MSDDPDIWICECGCALFFIRCDGLLECSDCDGIMQEARAEPRDVKQELRPN